MRLIDADKAKEKLRGNAQKDSNSFVGAIVEMFCEFLDQEPTLEDVAPVVRGRWEFAGTLLNGASRSWKCSVCGGVSPKAFDFCPNCGKKWMRRENMAPKDDYIDYGAVRINSKGKYQLNMAYTEITHLHTMLEDNRIPHLFHRRYDGWQVCYPGSENCRISAVQHYFSYGAKDNRIEIMGGITLADGTKNSVLGHLTAEDVFAR